MSSSLLACEHGQEAYIFKLTRSQGPAHEIAFHRRGRAQERRQGLGSALLRTAIAEIVGSYLPYLWLKKNGSPWLLVPALLSLAAFAWLLTLHPTAAGRVYAAYGGIYIGVAILWLWLVDGIRPTSWDLTGAAIAALGMGIIMLGPRAA
jgi:small multidrug resistance family-3 protein